MVNEVHQDNIEDVDSEREEVEITGTGKPRRRKKKREWKYGAETFPHSHRGTEIYHSFQLHNRQIFEDFLHGEKTAEELFNGIEFDPALYKKWIFQKRYV